MIAAPGQRRATAFGRVVAEANAAVVKEAGEGRPARQHIVDRLRGGGVARQPGAFCAHPLFEIGDKRLGFLLPHRHRSPLGRPLILRSMAKISSIRCTASTASGALRRSACSKKWRRPWLQKAASVTQRRGARHDEAVESYLGFRKDTGDRLKAVLTAEPDLVLAHCLRGYFMMLFGQRAMVPRAQRSLGAAHCV